MTMINERQRISRSRQRTLETEAIVKAKMDNGDITFKYIGAAETFILPQRSRCGKSWLSPGDTFTGGSYFIGLPDIIIASVEKQPRDSQEVIAEALARTRTFIEEHNKALAQAPAYVPAPFIDVPDPQTTAPASSLSMTVERVSDTQLPEAMAEHNTDRPSTAAPHGAVTIDTASPPVRQAPPPVEQAAAKEPAVESPSTPELTACESTPDAAMAGKWPAALTAKKKPKASKRSNTVDKPARKRGKPKAQGDGA